MSVVSGDKVVVCGAEGECLTQVRKVLGDQAGSLQVFRDLKLAVKAAQDLGGVVVVCAESLNGELDNLLKELSSSKPTSRVPLLIGTGNGIHPTSPHDGVLFLAVEQFGTQLVPMLSLAEQLARVNDRVRQLEAECTRSEQTVDELIAIGKLFAGRKDIEDLLITILDECRRVTGADSGSILLVEDIRKAGTLQKQLTFRVTHNDTFPVHLTGETLELDNSSIAGYAATSGHVVRVEDAANLPPGNQFSWNPSLDKRTGYLTKSVVVFPLHNHKDEVIGIIQLINKKRDRNQKLNFGDPQVVNNILPFNTRDLDLGEAVASQAAVALEKGQLLENMLKLFDGFVASSAAAVEVMDSATSGHCERLAQYAVMTALEINKVKDGPLSAYRFDKHKLRELRYAALLHDIGKLGVRESILKKDRRLTDDRLESIVSRFRFFKEVLKHKAFRQTLNQMLMGMGNVNKDQVEAQLKKDVSDLDEVLNFILQINSRGRLDDPEYEQLSKIKDMSLEDVEGTVHRYLSEDEFDNLSVRRGNLTPKERQEIEEHAVHTYNILASMPWLPEYSNVPEIAGGHHERMNGSGYPNNLVGDKIPIGAQILAILDIYEALTASDRPYKPPVPIDKALKILELEAEADHLNKEIVKLFIEKEVYKSVKIPQPKLERKAGSTNEAW